MFSSFVSKYIILKIYMYQQFTYLYNFTSFFINWTLIKHYCVCTSNKILLKANSIATFIFLFYSYSFSFYKFTKNGEHKIYLNSWTLISVRLLQNGKRWNIVISPACLPVCISVFVSLFCCLLFFVLYFCTLKKTVTLCVCSFWSTPISVHIWYAYSLITLSA